MITILIVCFVPILLTCIGVALACPPTIDYNALFRRELLPPPQESVISPYTGEPYDPEWGTQIHKSRYPLLNRPPNPDLDIVISKCGKPPVAYTYAQSLRGKPIAHYLAHYRLDSQNLPFLLPGYTTQEVADALATMTNAIGRYYPDTDTLELAPYVQDEHEDVVCEMLDAEVL